MRRERSKPRAFVGLVLLCLLWTANSLRADLFPREVRIVPQFERNALLFTITAAAGALFAWIRGAEWPRGRVFADCVLVGLGLFFAPAVLVHVSREWISELTRVALFSLVPLFAVVFEPHVGLGDVRRDAMIAAIIAVVGTLCVFPVDMPHAWSSSGAFCAVIVATACVAAANCRAVFIAAELPGRSLASFVVIASGAAAAGFVFASALTERPIWSWVAFHPKLPWTAAIDWFALLLLFWLMRHMSAIRMTTRFLVAPLLTNLSGLVMLRPTVGLRAGLGLLLIASGAGWLLFAREDEKQRDDSLRILNLE